MSDLVGNPEDRFSRVEAQTDTCRKMPEDVYTMSLCVTKPTIWVPTRSNTNQTVQSQKIARSLKFGMNEEEKLYYPYSENKGADQLRS